jgi:hypothetical protein
MYLEMEFVCGTPSVLQMDLIVTLWSTQEYQIMVVIQFRKFRKRKTQLGLNQHTLFIITENG